MRIGYIRRRSADAGLVVATTYVASSQRPAPLLETPCVIVFRYRVRASEQFLGLEEFQTAVTNDAAALSEKGGWHEWEELYALQTDGIIWWRWSRMRACGVTARRDCIVVQNSGFFG